MFAYNILNNMDSLMKYQINYQTIAIIVIVALLLWWLFSEEDVTKQVVYKVKTQTQEVPSETPSETPSEVPSEVPSAAPLEVLSVVSEMVSEIVSGMVPEIVSEMPAKLAEIIAPQEIQQIVVPEKEEEEEHLTTVAVVEKINEKNMQPQHAEIEKHDPKDGPVMYTATGKVVKISKLQQIVQNIDPVAHDNTNVNHSLVDQEKTVKVPNASKIKLIDPKCTDNESSISLVSKDVADQKIVGVPVAVNTFTSYASADHVVLNSEKGDDKVKQ